MYDMKGFYISASGAIQGHDGPLVRNCHSKKGPKSLQHASISLTVFEEIIKLSSLS